jgi:hypothetical protein
LTNPKSKDHLLQTHHLAPKQVVCLDNTVRSPRERPGGQSKVARNFLPGDVELSDELHRPESGVVMYEHDIVYKRIDGSDAPFIRMCELL